MITLGVTYEGIATDEVIRGSIDEVLDEGMVQDGTVSMDINGLANSFLNSFLLHGMSVWYWCMMIHCMK